MINHHREHYTGFFANREVTSLYFTIALVRFALGLVTVFIPIFLWELGYPLWRILLFYAIENVYFVLAAFAVLPLLRRMSDKSMLIASIPFFVGFAGLIPFIEYHPWLYWVIPLIAVFKSIFFNTGYHLDFSGASDKKDLGKELGMRFMIGSLVALAAPFLGGLIIGKFDYRTVFFLSAGILVLAIVPLVYFKKRKVSSSLTAKHIWQSICDRKTWAHTVSNIGYASEFVVGLVLWKLYLFLQIGEVETFGGVVSLSLLVSSLITFSAGSMTDNGKRKKVLFFMAIGTSLVWASRVFVDSALSASLSHLLLHLFYPALIVAWSSIFYHLAKKAKPPTTFILGREIITNLSRIGFYTFLIPMAYLLKDQLFFELSFLFAALFTLLFVVANKQSLRVFG